jgi:hypothetical protein
MMFRSDRLRKTAQRLSDIALGVQSEFILNSGSTTRVNGNLAAQMMQASKAMIADGIDPESGYLDYNALKFRSSYQHFKELTSALINLRLDSLGKGSAYLAFWINIYNVMIVDAIIHYRLQSSMMRRPGIFRQAAYEINGLRFSVDDIEHGILRRNQPNPVLPIRPFLPADPRRGWMVNEIDARVHFALVCGAKSCPPIAYYDETILDKQLDQAAGSFINGGGVRWDPPKKTLWLSKIFQWYRGDFGGQAGVISIIGKYTRSDEIKQVLDSRSYKIRHLSYNWSINHIQG